MQENGKDLGLPAADNEADDADRAGLAEATALPARKLNRLAETERKKARAAEKLRENLLRRKQQVRARRSAEAETGIGLPASGTGEDNEDT